MIGKSFFRAAEPEALHPFANPALPGLVGFPVRRKKTRRASPARWEELRVNRVVFGPGRLDRAGKRQDVFAIEPVIARRRSAVPLWAVLDRSRGVIAHKFGRMGILAWPPDLLQPPPHTE